MCVDALPGLEEAAYYLGKGVAQPVGMDAREEGPCLARAWLATSRYQRERLVF